MSAPYHLSPGTVLKQGRYRIEKTLGEGGFGITYKGIDSTYSVAVAIKELWPEKGIRQGSTVAWTNSVTPQVKKQQITKFQLEAQYLSKCVHSNIAKVYDWFEANNTAYIIMEFISGKSLYQVWKEEKPLLEERVKRYMIEVAEALKVVHTNNLLHRDIKPDNIIIDSQDRAVLIDFGATREFIANQTTSMTQLLTPGYAPLEQYSAKGKRYPATDIYALSASVYELLTNISPVEATERLQSETLIPPRQLRPELSPLIEQAILTGMKMRIAERFQTADELIRALQGNSTSLGSNSTSPKLIPVPYSSSRGEILLDKSQFIIGINTPDQSSVDIDLSGFAGGNVVSGKHARLYQETGQWKVLDLNSRNGTFIKRVKEQRFSKRITVPETLSSGDEIAFGKVRFRFQNT